MKIGKSYDDLKVGDLMHPAGTVVLCEDDHEVCDIVRDIHKGDADYASAFANWRGNQQEPEVGQPLPILCRCGAEWLSKYVRLVKWK